MSSASFNQLKWIHVLPGSEDEEAHMKIFTVPTADYDEDDNLISYNQDIEALTEENLFEVPQNLKIHKTEPTKQYVRYPYSAKN